MNKIQLLTEFLREEIRFILFERKYLTEDVAVISKVDAVRKIRAHKGQIFTVAFIKKTDGTQRIMNCRLGVTRYLKGGVLPYDAKAKGYIPVYDLQKKAYRILNTNTLTALKIGGEAWKVQ